MANIIKLEDLKEDLPMYAIYHIPGWDNSTL